VAEEEDGQDLLTHLGVVRGGLPSEPERADVAFILDEAPAGRVCVHAVRVEVDPAALGSPKGERALEVVGSFWMRREYFIATFGRVVADLERRST
jgi:hypothetical protein